MSALTTLLHLLKCRLSGYLTLKVVSMQTNRTPLPESPDKADYFNLLVLEESLKKSEIVILDRTGRVRVVVRAFHVTGAKHGERPVIRLGIKADEEFIVLRGTHAVGNIKTAADAFHLAQAVANNKNPHKNSSDAACRHPNKDNRDASASNGIRLPRNSGLPSTEDQLLS